MVQSSTSSTSSDAEGELSKEEVIVSAGNMDKLFPVDVFPKLLSKASRVPKITSDSDISSTNTSAMGSKFVSSGSSQANRGSLSRGL